MRRVWAKKRIDACRECLAKVLLAAMQTIRGPAATAAWKYFGMVQQPLDVTAFVKNRHNSGIGLGNVSATVQ